MVDVGWGRDGEGGRGKRKELKSLKADGGLSHNTHYSCTGLVNFVEKKIVLFPRACARFIVFTMVFVFQ